MKAIVILALCCVYVSAQSKQKLGELFDDVDTNKDGFVSPAEYAYLFSLFDVNQDGSVSNAEFVAVWVAKTGSSAADAQKFFALLDYNKDGQLSSAERTLSFSVFDRDGSGLVSKSEFLARLDEINA